MAGIPGKEVGTGWGMVTDRELREQRYEEYIADVGQGAAAVGRREPYHLTFLKRHGQAANPRRAASEEDGGRRTWADVKGNM